MHFTDVGSLGEASRIIGPEIIVIVHTDQRDCNLVLPNKELTKILDCLDLVSGQATQPIKVGGDLFTLVEVNPDTPLQEVKECLKDAGYVYRDPNNSI